MKKNSLIKSVSLITAFAIMTRLIGFLFRIYLSRQIGAEALGKYQIAFSVFGVLLTVIATGIPLTVSKMRAEYLAKNEAEKQKKFMASALLTTLAIAVVICGLLLALKPCWHVFFADSECETILLVLLPSVIFSALYGVFRGHFWGESNFLIVGISEFIEQVIRVVLCVVFLTSISGIAGGVLAGASLSVSSAISALVVAILYFALGGKLKKPDNSYKKLLKTSSPITGIRLVTSLTMPMISTILPAMLMSAGYTSSQAISQMGIATGMTLPFLFIPSTLVGSLAMAIIPDLSKARTESNSYHIENRVKSSITFTLFVSCFLVPIFIGAGNEIGKFFFGNYDCGMLLAKSAWLMIPMGITNITSAILNGIGKEKKSLLSSLVGTAVMTLFILVLPRMFGIMALFIALGLGMTASSCMNLFFIKKHVSIKLKLVRTLSLMCLCMLPSIAITSFLAGLLTHFFTLFFTLAISCAIGFLTFVLLLGIFKVIDINVIYVKIKHVSFDWMKSPLRKKKKDKLK